MNITCTIDNKTITVKEGATIFEAAQSAGIPIPTLCHLEGFPPYTSCMICVVLDLNADAMVPACSAPVVQGMEIDTQSPLVVRARQEAIDMLLAEHVGDCDAPCTRACPARPDTPRIIRHIIDGNMKKAVMLYREVNPFPALTGHICPAPCEKLCRRRSLDSSLSIRLLEKYVGMTDMEDAGVGPAAVPATQVLPDSPDSTGKRVAVIGAGPAGMASAYYICMKGHTCTLYEKEGVCGGEMRKSIPPARLPREVLDGQIKLLQGLGCIIKSGTALGTDISFTKLQEIYDAVILAVGRLGHDTSFIPRSLIHDEKIKINRTTFHTVNEGIFACGSCVGRTSMAVRGITQGRQAAEMVHRFLSGKELARGKFFDSIVRKYSHGELLELAKDASPGERVVPGKGKNAGYTVDEAVRESRRCMHCDCYKSKDCLLRKYAAAYEGNQYRYEIEGRKPVKRQTGHPSVIREMGKCIKCGRCVRLTRELDIGLGFVHRGMKTEVMMPFDFPLKHIPEDVLKQIVTSCPTGALCFKRQL
jgi:hypothetical protein